MCQECLDSIRPIRAPQCVQCGERQLPAQLLIGDGRCRGCRDFEPEFERAVSLHASKRGERGFNQAELIVRAARKRLPAQFEIADGLLKRQRPTHSQVGLSREGRIANMRGAFRVTDPQRVKGATVIIVDDVMTTGTTVSECARVLKRAGAERVWAATVARILKVAVLPKSVEYGEEEAHEAAEVAVSV